MHPHPNAFGRVPVSVVGAVAAMAAPIISAVPYAGGIVQVTEGAFAATRTPSLFRRALSQLDNALMRGAEVSASANALHQLGAAKAIRDLSRSRPRLHQVAGIAHNGDATAKLVTKAIENSKLIDMKMSAMSIVSGALFRKDPRSLAQIQRLSMASLSPGPRQPVAATLMSMVGACCAACAEHEDEEGFECPSSAD